MPMTSDLNQIQMPSELTNWKIQLLYDGQCPLCLREVNFLLKRDAGRGIVNFVDIASLNYVWSIQL